MCHVLLPRPGAGKVSIGTTRSGGSHHSPGARGALLHPEMGSRRLEAAGGALSLEDAPKSGWEAPGWCCSPRIPPVGKALPVGVRMGCVKRSALLPLVRQMERLAPRAAPAQRGWIAAAPEVGLKLCAGSGASALPAGSGQGNAAGEGKRPAKGDLRLSGSSEVSEARCRGGDGAVRGRSCSPSIGVGAGDSAAGERRAHSCQQGRKSRSISARLKERVNFFLMFQMYLDKRIVPRSALLILRLLGLRQFPLFISSHQKQRLPEAINGVRRNPGVIRYSRNERASSVSRSRAHGAGSGRRALGTAAGRPPRCSALQPCAEADGSVRGSLLFQKPAGSVIKLGVPFTRRDFF